MHRADLQRALLEAIAREPQHNTSNRSRRRGLCFRRKPVAVAIEQGAVRLKAVGDCLIGADGVRSFVRQRLGGDSARLSGWTAWRTTVDAARAPPAMRREETTLWLGRKAHLVHYPLRGGAIVNVVAVVDEEFARMEWISGRAQETGTFSERVFRVGTKRRGICCAPLPSGASGRFFIAIRSLPGQRGVSP